MKEVAGLGLGGKVSAAIKMGMRKAAMKDAAAPKQKKGAHKKDVYGGGCDMLPDGGGPADPDCESEHIKPGIGKVATFPDPDKEQQTGKEACK
jgi:hypothetical protein